MTLKLQAISVIGLFSLLFAGDMPDNIKGTESQVSLPGDSRNIRNSDTLTLFMCGDVMTGRGIDQILAYPGNPVLYEHFMKSAMGYVRLTERKNGRISFPVNDKYIWGYAIQELERKSPDLRMINLETAITKCNNYWKNKGINYRMNPENMGCLKVADIDYCSLANNHVLDWGSEGLAETLATLDKVSIKHSGAGLSEHEAKQPAIFDMNGKGRILIFAFGFTNSGIPLDWTSGKHPGVNLFTDYSVRTVKLIKNQVDQFVKEGDIVVASVHWGGNWGYEVDPDQVRFARQLIDEVGIDVIHGHSSHHVRGMEVYKGRLILYGCGDFLNDYEGISGHESYRDDLGLMYFVNLETVSGRILSMQMIPTKIKNFKVNRAGISEIRWMYKLLNRECRKYGTHVQYNESEDLVLEWK